MQKTIAKNGSKKSSIFQGIWLLSFLSGAAAGTSAAQYSASAMPHAAAELCAMAGDRLSVLSLLCSSAIFLAMLILSSQLPGGSVFVSLLTALKAMCMAYVLGLFYQFRNLLELDTALFHFLLHAALILPVSCGLACHCCMVRTGEGKILPFVLTFLYLLAAALLEFLFWGAGLV